MNLPETKELQHVITQCIKRDKKAQHALFNYCYSFALSICSRYCSDSEEAQEVLSDGMLKVFSNLHRYSSDLSFGGWVRKIMVNTAIDNFRKNKKFHDSRLDQLDESYVKEVAGTEEIISLLQSEDILKMVQNLPPAYRIVFTLHVVEEFTHREIAEKLGITEGTSKSNLSKARIKLQQSITNSLDQSYGKHR